MLFPPFFSAEKNVEKKAGRDCFDVAGGISPAAPGTAELDCCFFFGKPLFSKFIAVLMAHFLR